MIPRAETWPSDRLYWAVIDAPQWRRPGLLPPGLHEEAEEVLPIPASDLHLVCCPVEGGRLVVCGLPRADLERLSSDVLALTPETLPGCLGVAAAAESLNLLVGEFEPAAVASAKAWVHFAAMAALVVIAGLAMIGLHRRAAAWERNAASAAEATSALLSQHAPGQTADELAMEVQKRKSDATDAAVLKSPEEAAPALVLILQGWPAEQSAKPLSLNVTPRTAAVSLVVPGDPSGFIESFRAPKGWSLEEPRLNTTGDTTRVNLQLHRNQGVEG